MEKPADAEAPKKQEGEKPEPQVLRKRPLSMEIVGFFGRILVWLFFRIYGRGHVSGIENVPKEGAVLVAGNHASDLDPVIGWGLLCWRRKLWGIAKIELWEKPVTAYMMACMGGIPVKRGAVDRNMLRTVTDMLSKGEGVALFPEGTRSKDGKIQSPHAGVGLLVQKSGAPVVPVGIVGTYEMLPSGAKRIKPAKLGVRVGKPMTFPPETSREEIARQVMDAIVALVEAEKASRKY